MVLNRVRGAAFCALLLACIGMRAFSQEPLPTAGMPEQSSDGRFAVGGKFSSLGVGVEGAMKLSQHFNVRAGGNFFDHDLTETRDGITYQAKIRLQTVEGHLDFFPFGGNFHVSPGLLYYHATPVSANLNVPGGTSFTLGDTSFVSFPSDPVTGSARVQLNTVAPSITAGFGNLIPRKSGKHWSFPFEIGAAFHGTPTIGIRLAGSACDQSGVCGSVNSPEVQTALQQEIHKRNNQISWIKFYPILSMGVGYRF